MSDQTPRERRQYRRTTERRQEILVAVVQLLSDPDCSGVTTKDIARFMGVADGALYRHFTGKAAILTELIGFCNSAFERMFDEINAQAGISMVVRAKVKARALLLFAEANCGLTRLLTGEALCGEEHSIKEALQQILQKAEKAIETSLELAVVQQEIPDSVDIKARASLIMSYIQGRWSRYVASGFQSKPSENWEVDQTILFGGLYS